MPAATNAQILQACHEACGKPALERGRGCQARGDVLRCAWNGSAGRLDGEVRGDLESAYAVAVDIVSDRRGLRVEGECDCSDGYNCAHVAALVLQWLRQREGAAGTRSALGAWRDTLRQLHPNAVHRGASDQGECLVYEINLAVYRDVPRLVVEVSRVRRLKKGGFGKPARIGPADFSSYRLREIIDDHDTHILALLQGSHQGSSGSGPQRIVLEGELGALALGRMVESGRCFLAARDGGPLKPGPVREPSLSWRKEEGGLRLACALPDLGEEWLLTPTDPGYYIDPVGGRCGRVDSALSGRLLGRLCLLPPLGAADARAIARDLVTDDALSDLPPPVALDIRPLGEVTPVPRLTLEAQGSDATRRYGARVESVYAGLPVAHVMVDAREKLVVNDPRDQSEALVTRDVVAELGAIDTLSGLGFHIRREARVLKALPDAEADAEIAFWANFIDQGRSRLENQGWEVVIARDFELRVIEPSRWHLTPGERERGEPGENDWFSLALEVEVEGRMLPVLPMILAWLEGHGGDPGMLTEGREMLVPADDHTWVRIPGHLLRPVVNTLLELLDSEEGSRGEAVMHRLQAPLLIQLEQELRDGGAELGQWSLPETAAELGHRLMDFSGIQPMEPPSGLRVTLREYQRLGLGWLQFLRQGGFGGVLADDMGLGKTVQVLAHLLTEKEAGRLDGPSLVVVPTSLVSNWRREAVRFAPDLSVLVLHGNDRHDQFPRIPHFDLVITTYSLLPRDAKLLGEQSFNFVVLDEAQWIKNPATKAARTAFSLQTRYRLCVTGTPLENHPGELWSQFHFLMPGYLGNLEAFNRRFRHPIERQGDTGRSEALAARLRPFILRRTKSEVAAELPEKVEMESLVTMEGRQAALYETVRSTMESRVKRAIRDSGMAGSHITVLDALLKLRQVCCDPRLLKISAAKAVEQSAKLEMLMHMLPELVSEGRRILLFSQFTTMLGIIEEELGKHGISYSKLTGRTRRRDAAIDAFQNGDASVFLVSLKAGGVGLNLTAADTVILYDPWWNPAVERQAIDRAHRIGQDKTVFVYRLIVENSIEEKIVALQGRKQAMADSLVADGTEGLGALDSSDILALFSER